VRPGLRLVRESAVGPARAAGLPEAFTFDSAVWDDALDSPTGPLGGEAPVLLLHVGRGEVYDAWERYSELTDRRIYLVADGHPTLSTGLAAGGVRVNGEGFAVLHLGPADRRDLVRGVRYRIEPRNAQPLYPLRVADGLCLER
jgi:hypothetical protein